MDLSRLKGYAPLCFITAGILLWRVTSPYAAVLPWIIASMLFFAVVNMRPRNIRPRPQHLLLLLLQLSIGGGLYLLLSLWNRDVACSLFMCFLAPAATAAGAMTSLMGGDVGFATGYTIVTHAVICVLAPLLLPLIGGGEGVDFWSLSADIALLVSRMVVLPILLAWTVRLVMLRFGREPRPHRRLTYWLWLSTLIFILGRAVHFVSEEGGGSIPLLLASFGVGLVACFIQFNLGRVLAPKLGIELRACRQALGQKNTALVLWLCISFLHPLVAPGIAGYIAWQNFFLTYYMRKAHKN